MMDAPPTVSFENDDVDSVERIREKLRREGAVILKGYDIADVEDFSAMTDRIFGRRRFSYAGGASPRRSLRAEIYNSTEYPSDLTLMLHNELSYSSRYPSYVCFACFETAGEGGETTLGSSQNILSRIDPDVADEFRQKKVCYIRRLPAQGMYSWRAAFQTSEREEVEKICRTAGANLLWANNDTIEIREGRGATTVHPETRREVWFNQAAHFHPLGINADAEATRLNCTFGNGGAIPDDYIAHIRQVLIEEAYQHKWERGEMIILDNRLVAHGRMPFKGGRRITVTLI